MHFLTVFGGDTAQLVNLMTVIEAGIPLFMPLPAQAQAQADQGLIVDLPNRGLFDVHLACIQKTQQSDGLGQLRRPYRQAQAVAGIPGDPPLTKTADGIDPAQAELLAGYQRLTGILPNPIHIEGPVPRQSHDEAGAVAHRLPVAHGAGARGTVDRIDVVATSRQVVQVTEIKCHLGAFKSVITAILQRPGSRTDINPDGCSGKINVVLEIPILQAQGQTVPVTAEVSEGMAELRTEEIPRPADF